MERLSVVDTSFLIFESRKTPMHVGCLFTLDTANTVDGAADEKRASFANQLYTDLLAQQEVIAPYNRRVKFPLSGLPKWEEVSVELAYHLRLHHLPKPGDKSQLQTLVAQLHTPTMDLSRPPWELHIIDGLEHGQVALYLRIHHCMADGALFNRIVSQFLQSSANDRAAVAFWQQPLGKRPTTDSLLRARLKPLASMINQIGTLPSMAKLGSKMALNMLQSSKQRLALPYTAPSTVFNHEPQQAKALALSSVSMARIKHIGRMTGATLNEVVLTLCDLTLQRYLQTQPDAPKKPLVAMVPIKLEAQDTTPNNDISPALITLGQSNEAPAQRLATIITSSQTLKDEAVSMSPAAYYNYSVLAAALVLLGGKFKVNKHLSPACNLIVSNVAGPRRPLFLNGAKITSAYPLSALAPGIGLNITLYSYNGFLHIGFTYSNGALPDFERVSDYMTQAIDELELDVMTTSISAVRRKLDLLPREKPAVPAPEKG